MRASPRQKLQLSQQRQHAVLPRQHAVIARPVTCTAANPSGKQPQSEEETDLVTRWVGKIFGKQAIEDRSPGGLKRVVCC